ncbi:MAG: SnoaL-like domain [Thermoleophilaceae bacterium]|jgi:ketosteroid isomerase-like protein|nr:SnoaL-like domain [Thermoleophilaceae bacterium]
MSHADVIYELTGKWNSGDVEGVSDLYTEDAEMRTGPHWPEQATYRGREAIRATSADWASLWETLQIEIDRLDEYGDKMVATGAWRMRGAASGVDGEMPISIVFTFRDGKIAVLEWFADQPTAVAAARGD